MVLKCIYIPYKGGKGMQGKRVTIRIPFEIWRALRELQTMGKISSIQQAAVNGMNKLIESLIHFCCLIAPKYIPPICILSCIGKRGLKSLIFIHKQFYRIKVLGQGFDKLVHEAILP